jgi:pSer/pThr/pTyr-binding forkhead associated (FHA) protein
MSEVCQAPGSDPAANVAPPIPTDVAVPPGASVCVLRGFYEGLELAVDRPWWVIGRGRGADAVLAEATISRAHAAIGYEPGGGFFVQDLGSTNGTLVNGARTERAALRDGDEIRMGRLELRIGLPGAGGPS